MKDLRECIEFHFEDVIVDGFVNDDTAAWIRKVIENEGRDPGHLNFVFCSDEYLLRINREYLQHNDYTDIITFDYTEDLEGISGDVFISYDRVKENSKKFGVTTQEELYRVIVHGVLHLLEYKDVGAAEKKEMRAKENYYLSLLSL